MPKHAPKKNALDPRDFLSRTFGLHQKSALITGAAGGIGAGIAKAFSQAGASLTLLDLDQERLERVANEITDEGGQATAIGLDLTDLSATQTWLSQADPHHILVNCAGVNRMRSYFDMSKDDYDLIMGLNTKALYFLTQQFARQLIAHKSPGSIINISSQMGQVGGPSRSIYCASKHAVEGFTKAMAVELGEFGIRVNSICPTFVETDLAKDFLSDTSFREDVEKRICLNRLGTVEDVANAAVYLASPASGLVTGAALKVDGGWTAA